MLTLILFAILSTAYGRSSRIIGGSDVDPLEYPHQVSLRSYGSHICGGAVIGNEWVLTAAHCVGNNPNQYTVIINDHHRTDDDGKEVTLNVVRIIKHGEYGSGAGTFPNDIAALQVAGSIDDENIIQLAEGGEDFAGKTAYISGWGLTQTGGRGDLALFLQHVVRCRM